MFVIILKVEYKCGGDFRKEEKKEINSGENVSQTGIKHMDHNVSHLGFYCKRNRIY